MTDATRPANLQSTYVVIKPDQLAKSLPITDSVWDDLDTNYNNFQRHTLVASFSFTDDWPTWEVHPHGDEIVSLVSGNADMILRHDSGDHCVRLSIPGEFVIVPRGVWHTARVHEPTTMIFVTPGEGTENRENPESDS